MNILEPDLIDKVFSRPHFFEKCRQNISTGPNIPLIGLNRLFEEISLPLPEGLHLLFGELLGRYWRISFVVSDREQSLKGNRDMVDLNVREFGEGRRLQQARTIQPRPVERKQIYLARLQSGQTFAVDSRIPV